MDVFKFFEGFEDKIKYRKIIVMVGMFSKVECDVLFVYLDKKYNYII